MSKCAAEVPVSVLQVQFTAGVRLQESPAQHSQHVLVQERYACGTPTVCTLHSRLLIMFNNPHCDVCVAVDVPLQEYVDELLRPQSADALGSGEFKLFYICRKFQLYSHSLM